MEPVYNIDGHEVTLVSPDAYERTLREIQREMRPDDVPYITRIYDHLQVVIEKAKNPHRRTGQYYFGIKTIDGKKPVAGEF